MSLLESAKFYHDVILMFKTNFYAVPVKKDLRNIREIIVSNKRHLLKRQKILFRR